MDICREGALTKDILADLTLKELIVRLVQLQALDTISHPTGSGPLAYIVQYIGGHLREKMDVDNLSRKACMSKSNFFRQFRREYGISPVQYIIRERLRKARTMLADTRQPVNIVGLESGFEDVNHFIRLFKQSEGMTPGVYRNKLLLSAAH